MNPTSNQNLQEIRYVQGPFSQKYIQNRIEAQNLRWMLKRIAESLIPSLASPVMREHSNLMHKTLSFPNASYPERPIFNDAEVLIRCQEVKSTDPEFPAPYEVLKANWATYKNEFSLDYQNIMGTVIACGDIIHERKKMVKNYSIFNAIVFTVVALMHVDFIARACLMKRVTIIKPTLTDAVVYVAIMILTSVQYIQFKTLKNLAQTGSEIAADNIVKGLKAASLIDVE